MMVRPIDTQMLLIIITVDCLSGFAIQLVFSDGRPPEDMVFGSNATVYNITERHIVGFHGLLAPNDNCIRRLGIYMQMDSSELKGESLILKAADSMQA